MLCRVCVMLCSLWSCLCYVVGVVSRVCVMSRTLWSCCGVFQHGCLVACVAGRLSASVSMGYTEWYIFPLHHLQAMTYILCHYLRVMLKRIVMSHYLQDMLKNVFLEFKGYVEEHMNLITRVLCRFIFISEYISNSIIYGLSSGALFHIFFRNIFQAPNLILPSFFQNVSLSIFTDNIQTCIIIYGLY